MRVGGQQRCPRGKMAKCVRWRLAIFEKAE